MAKFHAKPWLQTDSSSNISQKNKHSNSNGYSNPTTFNNLNSLSGLHTNRGKLRGIEDESWNRIEKGRKRAKGNDQNINLGAAGNPLPTTLRPISTNIHVNTNKEHNQKIMRMVLGGFSTGLENWLSSMAAETRQHELETIMDDERNSLLHVAAHVGSRRLVQLLVDYGAPVKAVNLSTRETPLHVAGNEVVGKILLRHGAVITAKNVHGESPLHTAASRGDKALVELLLFHGANANEENRSGLKPIGVATQAVQPVLAVHLRKNVLEGLIKMEIHSEKIQIPSLQEIAAAALWRHYIPTDALASPPQKPWIGKTSADMNEFLETRKNIRCLNCYTVCAPMIQFNGTLTYQFKTTSGLSTIDVHLVNSTLCGFGCLDGWSPHITQGHDRLVIEVGDAAPTFQSKMQGNVMWY